jgi:hypothetical protein
LNVTLGVQVRRRVDLDLTHDAFLIGQGSFHGDSSDFFHFQPFSMRESFANFKAEKRIVT